MENRRIPTLVFLLCIPSITWPQDQPHFKSSGEGSPGVALIVVREEQTETTLRLRYQIRNSSRQDIWACDRMDIGGFAFEAVWAADGQSLVIRRRTEIPWGVLTEPPEVRYVRVPAGDERTETLLLPLPLCSDGVISEAGTPPSTGHVNRLTFETGYYEGDLPTMIRKSLAGKQVKQGVPGSEYYTPEALSFNETNELDRITDEEVLFYVEPNKAIAPGERVVKAVLDGQQIPADGPYRGLNSAKANLKKCTRLQILFEPSAFDFYFPYSDQKGLLNATETEALQSVRTTVVDQWTDVTEFIYHISKACRSGIALQGTKAQVTCYDEKTRLIALDVYEDCFVVETGESFACPALRGKYRSKWRQLAPEMRLYELRLGCADNLKDLYSYLRLYSEAEHAQNRRAGRAESAYPASAAWCDQMSKAFTNNDMPLDFIDRSLACPAAGKGKCHYAMNPDCRHDSPGDVVLLFETRAGWNQHGGSELFAFDNHDPRGGLVLLNDGTVRFIRSEDELRQLRWK